MYVRPVTGATIPIWLGVVLLAGAGCTNPWVKADRANTIAAYERYLRDFGSQGMHSLEAQTRLAQLRAERDWKIAQTQHSIDGYGRFLNAHPQSTQADEARLRRNDLLAQKDWPAVASADKIAAYESFLGKHPQSEHAPEARLRLDVLREQQAAAAWQTASEANSIIATEQFLEAFGTSQYAPQARERLSALRERQERDNLRRIRAAVDGAKKLRALPLSTSDYAKNIMIRSEYSTLAYQGGWVQALGVVHAKLPRSGDVWVPMDVAVPGPPAFMIVRLDNVPQPKDVIAHAPSGSIPIGHVVDAKGALTLLIPRELVPVDLEFKGLSATRVRFGR